MDISLVQKNGQKVETELAGIATYWKNKNGGINVNFQADRRYVESFNERNDTVRDFIAACEDAAFIGTRCELHFVPETKTILNPPNPPKAVNGYFLGLEASFQDGEIVITGCVTNLECPSLVISACAAVAVSCGLEDSAAMRGKTEELREALFKEQIGAQIMSDVITVKGFLEGDTAVTCRSEKAYAEFKDWLTENGFVIEKTLRPEYWDDLTKYIYCHREDVAGETITSAKSMFHMTPETDRIIDSEQMIKSFENIMSHT